MLRLALSSWSLHRHLPYYGSGSWRPEARGEVIALDRFPAIARSFGIDRIEICQTHLASSDPRYLSEIAASVRESGCEVINVPIDAGNIAQADPEARADDLQLLRSWIEAAQILGAPAVRVNSGHVGAQEERQAFAHAVSGYRELAAFCAERQMTLLLENHWGLSAAPATIQAFLEAVDAPNFRLCPDFGNFAPEIRLEGLTLMIKEAAIVHAKVLDLDQHGIHTAFDLNQCFDLVRTSGYSGPLSIEFEGVGDQLHGIGVARELIVGALGDLLETS